MPQSVRYKHPGRLTVIAELRKAAKQNEAPIWASIAKALDSSRRSRREVNLHRINRHTQQDDIAVVPGKVLGDGFLDHKVDIAAWQFTLGAKKKIESAGGKALTISELIKQNPTGSKLRYIG